MKEEGEVFPLVRNAKLETICRLKMIKTTIATLTSFLLKLSTCTCICIIVGSYFQGGAASFQGGGGQMPPCAPLNTPLIVTSLRVYSVLLPLITVYM